MARIIAGVATSHIPTIAGAIDSNSTNQGDWPDIFNGYEFSKKWIADQKPDVVILVYNDHACSFTLDLIPTFVIGCAEEFRPVETVWGPRPVPVVKGHPELAWHIAQSCILDEFDITIASKLDVDHGLTVPMSLMFGTPVSWPCKVVPVSVNVVQFPPPTGNRCYNLGKAIRRAVGSFDQDLKVIIFGTGGMSHQLQGARAGLINREFDATFLNKMTADPEGLTRISHVEYVREAGSEGIELVMWLVMRGALESEAREIYRFHYKAPVSNTALGHLILENPR